MHYEWFPVDISAAGHNIDRLFWYSFSFVAGTFWVVVAALVYFLVRYRAQPGRRAYYTHGDSRAALGTTLFLALLVFFGIDVNFAFHDHHVWQAMWGSPPSVAESVRVEIMPEQFAWNIRYAGPDGEFRTADDVVTINQLHIPLGKTVIAQLSSKDVIHSFFLPNMRIKMDAMPGMVTSLYFQAAKTGVYDIACAEHCGFGHYRMQGFLTVESKDDFEAWLKQQAVEQGPADLGWGWSWSRGLGPAGSPLIPMTASVPSQPENPKEKIL